MMQFRSDSDPSVVAAIQQLEEELKALDERVTELENNNQEEANTL